MRLFALILALVLALTPAASQAAGTRVRVSVYAKLISNDHVGSDWIIDTWIPGLLSLPGLDPARLPASGWITLAAGDQLVLSVKITEDEAYPDVAEESVPHTVTAAELRAGFDVTIPLTVTEDRGRYKGRTAEWEITFSFRP